jgi:hypothetical protein
MILTVKVIGQKSRYVAACDDLDDAFHYFTGNFDPMTVESADVDGETVTWITLDDSHEFYVGTEWFGSESWFTIDAE